MSSPVSGRLEAREVQTVDARLDSVAVESQLRDRVLTADGTVHVLPAKSSWIVTRVAPQFNASFDDAGSAVVQARALAQRAGALMLVHRADSVVIDREDYDIALPEGR